MTGLNPTSDHFGQQAMPAGVAMSSAIEKEYVSDVTDSSSIEHNMTGTEWEPTRQASNITAPEPGNDHYGVSNSKCTQQESFTIQYDACFGAITSLQ